MPVARISIGAGRKESLQQMVERYKRLAEPKTVYMGLTFFTLQQDIKLYELLRNDPSHPKDTGLLKRSWLPPARRTGGGVTEISPTGDFSQYRSSFSNKRFNVYVLNNATVGKQQDLKYAQMGWSHFKKRTHKTHYRLRRYMPFVDARTEFYTKKLRTIRQQMDGDWKRFVSEYLYESVGIM